MHPIEVRIARGLGVPPGGANTALLISSSRSRIEASGSLLLLPTHRHSLANSSDARSSICKQAALQVLPTSCRAKPPHWGCVTRVGSGLLKLPTVRPRQLNHQLVHVTHGLPAQVSTRQQPKMEYPCICQVISLITPHARREGKISGGNSHWHCCGCHDHGPGYPAIPLQCGISGPVHNIPDNYRRI